MLQLSYPFGSPRSPGGCTSRAESTSSSFYSRNIFRASLISTKPSTRSSAGFPHRIERIRRIAPLGQPAVVASESRAQSKAHSTGIGPSPIFEQASGSGPQGNRLRPGRWQFGGRQPQARHLPLSSACHQVQKR
jgi:hypothetical protein